uniref:Fibrinogen C-terminal domain-containing protein n=1 Tax=Biomphalaria glabrata TaxID=6526 RepID=A0A2C9L955_BIOGL
MMKSLLLLGLCMALLDVAAGDSEELQALVDELNTIKTSVNKLLEKINSSMSSCCKVGQPLPCANHYRNNEIMDNWSGFSEVALFVYKNNMEVHHVTFDAIDSTFMNWLNKSRIKDSTWTDITSEPANVFSLYGQQKLNLRRTFFLNSNFLSCGDTTGWFVAIDNERGGCSWEKNTAFPVFKYSTANTKMNWNSSGIDTADYFAIYVH